MEIKVSYLLAVLASLMMVAQVFTSPIGDASQGSDIQEQKRPKYMDTRDLDYFKDLLMFSLDELIDEHKINPDIFVVDSKPAVKRAGHIGLCYRRTASGFSAQPCWKADGRR